MSKIKFVTDSGSDLPRQIAQELGIQVLSFSIAMDGREILDGVDYEPEAFYRELEQAEKIPTHSQLTPNDYLECFETAFSEGYSDLIYAGLNSRGSSTFGNSTAARIAFYEAHPEAAGRFAIHLLDSLSYTMSYGYPTMVGAQMARDGSSIDEILRFMQDWIDHVRVLIIPFDLSFARKSARINAVAAFLGDVMGLRPVISFDGGESHVHAKIRGDNRAIAAMVSQCKNRDPDAPYLCFGSDTEQQLAELVRQTTAAFGKPPAMRYLIGGVISINAGPNMIGIVYRTN